MNAKLINDGPEKTYAVIFDAGGEFHAGLAAFAKEHGLAGSRLTAIGAFGRATLGYFDRERKECQKIPVDEQVEVLALIAPDDG